MKKFRSFAVPALTLALLAAPALAANAQQYGSPQQGYPQQQQQQGYQQGDNRGQWDAPPSEFNDLNRRAFHDGMEAARSDWRAHQPMDARRSSMFRRPPAPREFRDEYRRSFSRGYQVAMEHRDRWQDHDHDNDNRPH